MIIFCDMNMCWLIYVYPLVFCLATIYTATTHPQHIITHKEHVLISNIIKNFFCGRGWEIIMGTKRNILLLHNPTSYTFWWRASLLLLLLPCITYIKINSPVISFSLFSFLSFLPSSSFQDFLFCQNSNRSSQVAWGGTQRYSIFLPFMMTSMLLLVSFVFLVHIFYYTQPSASKLSQKYFEAMIKRFCLFQIFPLMVLQCITTLISLIHTWEHISNILLVRITRYINPTSFQSSFPGPFIVERTKWEIGETDIHMYDDSKWPKYAHNHNNT